MKIKDLMTPVERYQTLGLDASLSDVVNAIHDGAHRDILVVDDTGAFAGVVTMIDIIIALEPNYKKLNTNDLGSDILSNRFVADQFKEYNLWSNTLTDLCGKSLDLKARDLMHVPEDSHYIDENSDLEHGVHLYIMGATQPLIVRQNGTVTGILRMADVFDEIINRMSTCAD
ncbi:CBS domain-containing protein [Pseudodesulfovibrio sp. JC047]|uniref:CBS domain-containing protein n=1 Tax=Pseudodesulfovibrio sp. JC047 TaxID=2683199 RepID=UPI0013D7D598|nr:CBS domain-containing protein [Pseudodesulfovibrio sp. JC047]NDV19624.1 CBS domain-containing protein [Pseudodesulfovibrio sp. JC047]